MEQNTQNKNIVRVTYLIRRYVTLIIFLINYMIIVNLLPPFFYYTSRNGSLLCVCVYIYNNYKDRRF